MRWRNGGPRRASVLPSSPPPRLSPRIAGLTYPWDCASALPLALLVAARAARRRVGRPHRGALDHGRPAAAEREPGGGRPRDADVPVRWAWTGCGSRRSGARSRRRPTRAPSPPASTASNHADSRYAWGPFDRVVDSAAHHGLKVMISISMPAPIWATGQTRTPNPLWKPSVAEFAAFSEAVAKRYAALRRPLRHLQRAQPGRVAAAPERPQGPVRPAPLPQHGAGLIPAR